MSDQIQEEQLEQEIDEVVEEQVEGTIEEETEEPVGELETEEPPKPKKKSDSVPLAKYMEVKNRLKDYEKAQIQQQAERDKMSIKQDLIARGWPEMEAEIQSNNQIRQYIEMEEIKSKLVDGEIKELAQSDGFFADAMTFKADIREKMRQWNCDAETAYMAIRGKARTREYQLEQEQRVAAKRRPAQTKKVETAAASAPKTQYKLDEADRKALEGLQKAMPDAGWTIAKYHKMMKT
ncbi:MAG: hypothetical protein WC749_02385 [Dehalococcoidia bacterium]